MAFFSAPCVCHASRPISEDDGILEVEVLDGWWTIEQHTSLAWTFPRQEVSVAHTNQLASHAVL